MQYVLNAFFKLQILMLTISFLNLGCKTPQVQSDSETKFFKTLVRKGKSLKYEWDQQKATQKLKNSKYFVGGEFNHNALSGDEFYDTIIASLGLMPIFEGRQYTQDRKAELMKLYINTLAKWKNEKRKIPIVPFGTPRRQDELITSAILYYNRQSSGKKSKEWFDKIEQQYKSEMFQVQNIDVLAPIGNNTSEVFAAIAGQEKFILRKLVDKDNRYLESLVTTGRRTILVDYLARSLGLNLTSKSEVGLFSHNGQTFLGVKSAFIEGKQLSHFVKAQNLSEGPLEYAENSENLVNGSLLAFFAFLLGDNDLHTGNIMVDAAKNGHLFDFDSCFTNATRIVSAVKRKYLKASGTVYDGMGLYLPSQLPDNASNLIAKLKNIITLDLKASSLISNAELQGVMFKIHLANVALQGK